ncbi:hypothetical protein C4K68_07240 [Pokkaliibacter plantistimulans]|uniref:diguanylate cyclase n=1 Tax=Proteobacteria bacterium 228 TaxID=2083153 RepID=A0A2S5KUV2_9PROT|nr:diguanylate cyclase [Pokkaliibacter plantistimulans]PPC78036.1 hypothetical protein C4K68_07240 [Pokkaliibacter plantistimulans]
MTDVSLIAKPPSSLKRILLVTLAIFVPLFAALYVSLDIYDQQQRLAYISREDLALQNRVTALNTELDRSLSLLRNLPQVLAQSRDVTETLAQSDSQAMRNRLNRFLARATEDLKVDIMWAMDRTGDTVAASNYDQAASLIGGNYAYRDYFKTALAGGKGHQFAIGATTLVPGFYFSAPVTYQDEVIGVVAMKINVSNLLNWVMQPNVMVSDSVGLVIMASNPDYVLRAMPDSPLQAMSDDQQLQRYQQHQFEKLRLDISDIYGGYTLWRLGNNTSPALIKRQASHENDFEGIAYSYLDQLDELDHRHTAHLLIALVASGLLSLAIASTLVYLLRSHDGERQLRASNAKLEMLNNQLEALAGEDPLTGIFNRRKLDLLLEEEWTRSRRYRRPLSVAVLDLDYFKKINDTLGHGAGDAVLIHVAQLLSSNKRSTDILARLGGEEFVMVLPETHAQDAQILMERLRQMISAEPTPWKQESITVTISIGITSLGREDKISDLLRRADEALYEAKGAGRNQVYVHCPQHVNQFG